MERHSQTRERDHGAQVVVLDPDGVVLAIVPLSGPRVTVGRLPDTNDIALQPDPERFVTRAAHCTLEQDGGQWFLVDGGSVNGTFLRRGGAPERVHGRAPLRDGDVVCVLASIAESGERRYFELALQALGGDSQATRAVLVHSPASTEGAGAACLSYDVEEARLVLVRGDERHEIHVRAQAHRLIRHMAQRNAAIGGSPALCTHDELMRAVWGDEPMHTRTELAKLVWELRRSLQPYGAERLVENERRRGYRLRTCPE
jgi:FHA domain/Transcriptional regulatory protein, C terminal